MSKPRPIEITISVHELQQCYRQGFKATGDMPLHILQQAGFRFEPARPGQLPEMCKPWRRVDSPEGYRMTFQQWPEPEYGDG